METAFWANALKPFALLVMMLPAIPVTLAIRRWMKDGKFKAALLDRTLPHRRPWILWLAFFACYASVLLGAWLGLTFN